MERYSRAVYSYLFKILGDREAADEVFQEFALDFLRGSFRHADPQQGRFRNYLKVAVVRRAGDYRRRRMGRMPQAPGGLDAQLVASPEREEGQFLECCREEVLGEAWRRLQVDQEQSGTPFHAVLQLKSSDRTITSEALAAELQARSAQPYTPAGVRKLVQRARERFAGHLIDAVIETLPDARKGTVEQELVDLQLLPYCRAALRRRYGEVSD